MPKKPIDHEKMRQRFHAALGDSIQAWARLELSLMLILSILLRTEQFRTRMIWAALPNMRSRRRLLASLGETFLDDSCIEEYRALLKRVKRLSETRNMYAHHISGVDSETGKIFFLQDSIDGTEGATFLKNTELQISNVEQFPKHVDALIQDVMAFGNVIAENDHSWPKTHRAGPGDPNS